jgi:DnaJ-class molecular chaperone
MSVVSEPDWHNNPWDHFPPECPHCEGRGYFDSRHGYQGHTTCTWCRGTGRRALEEK